MNYYRELARDIGGGGAEQNEGLPSARNVVHPYNNSLPVNTEPRFGGHDEVFDPPVQAGYECPICKACLRDPVQTACGHRFCKSCIHRHMSFRLNDPKCPIDNEPLEQYSQLFTDNFAKREINQFTVKCRTVRSGKECPWKGELHKIENHLATCEFLDVLCSKGCGQTVERRALDNHVKNECPKRMTTCPHCKTDVQHRNYVVHLGRCAKVNDNCPQCSKEMLREKIQHHLKECRRRQVALRSPPAVSLPNVRSRSNTTSGNLQELNGEAANNEESGNQRKEKRDQSERDFCQILALSPADTTNNIAELESRLYNGVFLGRITGYANHLQNARQQLATEMYSSPIYTRGYKLCLRINPNGVETGYGSHISLFVHMMQSERDDTLEWPFSGRISLSILDQSDDGEYKRHISATLVTPPNLLAFQRPTTPINPTAYGYVEFARQETLQERQYLKDDCLLVQVQV